MVVSFSLPSLPSHPPSREEILYIGSAIGTVYLAAKIGSVYMHKYRLNKIVSRRREEREQTIREAEKNAEKLSLERRKEIGGWDFETLREKLQTGKISAFEALQTYQWKALQAHKRTNCVTLFLKEAAKWATDLDSAASSSDFKKGPLFGVPVSLKECVPVKGYDTTRGYVQECYMPSTEDCVMVEHIKNLGGIPFVQTNVPQSLLAYSCTNPVYGDTCHPDHKDRTSGGSSGGESALIGAGGSLLGIGGDVGGSIRLPCHFCGLAGIKPSHLRFSHRGIKGSVPGRPLINANDGPMAPDVHTCVEFLKAVWRDDFIHEREFYCPPVKWNEKLFEKGNKYKIGYYVDDGWFTPTPACQRAVIDAKEILEKEGHTLVPFSPPRVSDVFQMFIGAVSVDGGRYLLEKMGNDIMDPRYAAMLNLYRIPFFLQTLIAYILKPIYPRMTTALLAMPRTTTELRLKYEAIENYRHEFSGILRKEGIDALLCPVHVLASPHHDVPVKLFAGVTYTGIFNLLDFAAGVVPITQVNQMGEKAYTIRDENRDSETLPYLAIAPGASIHYFNELDEKLSPAADEEALKDYPTSDPWYRVAKETTKGSIGLPVGVQVAAPPYREEICLRLMQDLEDSKKNKQNGV